MRTMNRGEVWESILDVKKFNGTFGRDYVTVFRFFTSEHHPEVIYAYVLDQTKVNPVLLRTENATTSNAAYVKWEVVPQIPRPGWIMGMAVDADDPKQFWMTYKNVEPEGKVYRFNGQRYVDVTANLGWCLIESIVLDKSSEERIYVGSNHGVFTRDKREKHGRYLKAFPERTSAHWQSITKQELFLQVLLDAEFGSPHFCLNYLLSNTSISIAPVGAGQESTIDMLAGFNWYNVDSSRTKSALFAGSKARSMAFIPFAAPSTN